MKTKIKKLGALMLALALVLTMSSTALAAIGNDGIDANGGNTLTFTKSILMKNANGSNVLEPTITYTYTITDPGISGKTVTDSNGYVGQVYSYLAEANVSNITGVLETNTATAVYSDTNAAVVTSETGVEDTRPVSFTFNPAGFPHAGIYRFLVTETTSEAKANVGIVTSENYSNTMFLDVYVTGSNGSNSINAYVLFETGDTDITHSDESTNNTHQKSAGWSNGSGTGTGDYGVAGNQDIYETYDIEVTKAIDGDSYAQNHEFPFTVTLGTNGTANKITGISVEDGTLGTTPSNVSTGASTTITATLKNSGKLTITGIPSIAATTVDVTETNDTYDVYTVTTTVDGTANAEGVIQNGQSLAVNQVSVAIDNLAKKTIAYNNDLTEISPTGVVLRYGPYALILIFGVVILMLSRRRKEEEN